MPALNPVNGLCEGTARDNASLRGPELSRRHSHAAVYWMHLKWPIAYLQAKAAAVTPPYWKRLWLARLRDEDTRISSLLGWGLLERLVLQANDTLHQRPGYPPTATRLGVSLSHAHGFIVAAAVASAQVGIDLEPMTQVVGNSQWVRREAVSKAAGVGLRGVHQVQLGQHTAQLFERRYYLYPVTIATGTECWLACDRRLQGIALGEVSLDAL